MPRHCFPAFLIAATSAAAAAAHAGCGGASAEARRAEALLEQGDLAGARRAAELGLERSPRDPDLRRIEMRALLQAGDARTAVARYGAWRAVRGREDEEALHVLARTTLWQGLRTRSPAIQTAAVQAIERLELDDLAPAVAQLIASDDDLVAAAAASALLTAHPQAPQVLVALLRSDDPAARALAVDGIGRKAGVHARADLVPMLGDPAAEVRRAAVDAVARFVPVDVPLDGRVVPVDVPLDGRVVPVDVPPDGGSSERQLLERLVAMARRDPDGPVRARAVRTLAGCELGHRAEFARQAAADPYLGVRLAAIELLARGDSTDAAAALDRLAGSPDLHVAVPAVAARLRAGHAAATRSAAAVFERALVHPSWTVRAAALNLVPVAHRELALSLAGRGIADPRAEVRLAAARLLIRLGRPERAQRELIAELTHRDPLVRLDAAVDLVRRGDRRGMAPLDRLARSPSSPVRRAAVRAHAAAAAISSGLVAALADPAPDLRLAAAEVLLARLD